MSSGDLVAVLERAARGIEEALYALDNDRLAGQYVRTKKQQHINDRSMNAELAHVAMESEAEARAILVEVRAALDAAKGAKR